jgi:TolB-like protein/DNA-binding winged helix-turn-helix (wHTH) protein
MKAPSAYQNGPTAEIFTFGQFELDSGNGELLRSGRRIRVQEQPLEILLLLLGRPGDLTTRDELRDRLWTDRTFVDFDHGIRTAISKLRDALGDDAENPRFIETVPRRGYRFIAPVGRRHLLPSLVAGANADSPASRSETGVSSDAVDQGGGPVAGQAVHRRIGAKRRRLTMLLSVSCLLLTGAVLVLVEVGRLRHGLAQPIRSIAVLPLENVSHKPEQEYFSDGMTEELIATLGNIRTLRVISQTTTMHYKGTRRTLPEIARELGVEAVLEGSVRRAGDQVRISVQLVRVRPEQQVWAGSYERDLRDVLKLQVEVARSVAEEIRGKLTPELQKRFRASTVNPEAYEAYLKAEYARKRSAGGMVAGIQHFREAIAKDRSYAPAYVGLALLDIQMAWGYGPLPPSEALGETRQAAREALKLDPALAEAASCLAWVKAFEDWQWGAAEQDFRRGVELGPNSSEAHRLYAWYLSAMTRHKEAIAHSTRARELDPASLVSGYAVGATFWWSHQWDRVAAEAERLEQMDPTFPGAQRLLGGVCLQTSSYGQAIRHYQREIALCSEGLRAWGTAHLGCAHARAGERAEALRLLAELQSAAKERYVSPYLFAILHTSIGNKDIAVQWLEKAFEERNPMLAFLRVDSLFDPLRSDQRFQDLVRRMNFPS